MSEKCRDTSVVINFPHPSFQKADVSCAAASGAAGRRRRACQPYLIAPVVRIRGSSVHLVWLSASKQDGKVVPEDGVKARYSA
jgi:hypothetical protein